jgi:hypothetical protein
MDYALSLEEAGQAQPDHGPRNVAGVFTVDRKSDAGIRIISMQPGLD